MVERMKRLGKPVAACVVAGCMAFGVPAQTGIWLPAAVAAEASQTQYGKLVLQKESIVSSGVTQKSYLWTRVKNNQTISTNVNVVVADLHNPNVKLDVMTGRGGQFTKRANVLNMTRETGAIAGINGDYYNTSGEGAPLGPQIADGTLMATPTTQLTGMYSFGITKENKPIIETFTFEGSVTAPNGQSFPLAGMNRSYAWFNNVHTHGNAIHMYTSAWGSADRANDGATTPTEVLVVDGVIEEIVPNGTIDGIPPENGYILRAAGKGAEFVNANLQVGDELDTDVSLLPVNPNLTYTQDDFKMLIGGHTILLIDGKAASFTRDVSSISGGSNTARSAVGFSKDGRYVYLVAADHAGDSVGPTLTDFQKLLVSLGLWRAVNLDGGGSTTLVSRPLGEFETELVNVPKDGSQRSVVNGIGIFTTAAPAALKDFIVEGPSLLWKGQTATYAVKAYDVNYNPLDPATLSKPVAFRAEGALQADAAGAIVTAAAGGQGTVVAYSGQVSEALAVEVLDATAIQKLEIVPSKSAASWVQGDAVRLQLKATLKDGRTGTVPADLAKWQTFGLAGAVTGDTLTFEGFADGAEEAMLVARYDGFSAPLAVPVPKQSGLTNFTKTPWTVAPETYPSHAIGSVDIVGTDNKYLQLSYDFTAGDGKTDMAAYATFNGSQGVSLADGSTALKLDVLGDGQGGWLRAEFADANGATQRRTIADRIDWTGWKTLSVDLKDFDAVALKRIYVVSKSQTKGILGIDNLALVSPDAEASGGAADVRLTIGKKDVSVSGEARQLDVAPLIEKERTYVPVRFVVDALGGSVDWDAGAKKVTIRKDGHYIELWIDRAEMIADGARTTSDAPPILRSGRTMLPLRFVSEQLGLNVAWDPATKSITIQEK